jgi:hypothetical protein
MVVPPHYCITDTKIGKKSNKTLCLWQEAFRGKGWRPLQNFSIRHTGEGRYLGNA